MSSPVATAMKAPYLAIRGKWCGSNFYFGRGKKFSKGAQARAQLLRFRFTVGLLAAEVAARAALVALAAWRELDCPWAPRRGLRANASPDHWWRRLRRYARVPGAGLWR